MKLQNILYKALEEAKDQVDECGGCERDGVDWTHGHDHEASMAESELKDLISNASKVLNVIQPGDQLPGWISAYITLAADYVHSVAEYMHQKQDEMGADGQVVTMATPGFAIYENGKGGTDYYKPVMTKDPNYPTFLKVKIKYPTGGFLKALGTSTASGQESESGAIKALAVGEQVKKKLQSKYNLEDIEVADLKNGTVEVFAVSDDFINL